MRHALQLVLGVAILFVAAIVYYTRTSHDTLPRRTASPIKLIQQEGASWNRWLVSADAKAFNPSFKAVLSEAIQRCERRGGAADSFRVRRTHRASALTPNGCYPFEKQHAAGKAIDVKVGDCNGDGQIDLVDACRFAAELGR